MEAIEALLSLKDGPLWSNEVQALVLSSMEAAERLKVSMKSTFSGSIFNPGPISNPTGKLDLKAEGAAEKSREAKHAVRRLGTSLALHYPASLAAYVGDDNESSGCAVCSNYLEFVKVLIFTAFLDPLLQYIPGEL